MAYYNLGLPPDGPHVYGDYLYTAGKFVQSPQMTGSLSLSWNDGSTPVTASLPYEAAVLTSVVSLDMSMPATQTYGGRTYDFVTHMIRRPNGSVFYNTTAQCGVIDFDIETTASTFCYFCTAYKKRLNTYTIQFTSVGQGVSGLPQAISVTEGDSVTIPPDVPTRDGYTFLGWASSSTATEPEYVAGDEVTPTASMTLWAVWEEYVPPTPPSGDGSGMLAYGTSGSLAFDETSGLLVYS
jgi:uncharacterized repeat protein (TIGR02543 family)